MRDFAENSLSRQQGVSVPGAVAMGSIDSPDALDPLAIARGTDTTR